MASLALDPAYRRISVEEFLALDLGDAKAELDDGLIYMMAGGTAAHARIAINMIVYLRVALRGSGCRPFGSDLAMRTGERTVRFPDVSIYCDLPTTSASDQLTLLGDPKVVVEVLSPSTTTHDHKTKLEEYRGCCGVMDIALVDPQAERVRLVSRTGSNSWTDRWIEADQDLPIPSLGLVIPHTEIFARD
jgi:Uma2 family endonuclease